MANEAQTVVGDNGADTQFRTEARAARRLYILHKLPTPYNDDFFRALDADGDIQLQVYHLWEGSDRRPWKSQLATGYPNHFMRPRAGVDD